MFAQQDIANRVGSTSAQQLMYPNPFFDIGSTYLPNNIKELFQYCKYYALTNPIINAIITKLATYSVTDLVINEQDEKLSKKWDDFLSNQLNYLSFRINANLDREAYGNALISIHFPFVKILKCSYCKQKVPITGAKYKYEDFEFRLTCKKCGNIGKATAEDRYIKAANKIKLIRWDPNYIDIKVNKFNQDRVYQFNPPRDFYNDLLTGRKAIVEDTPQPFLLAAKEKWPITISKENLYHLERASVSSDFDGWGLPRIFPILKDAFYTQLMQKANEALLMEHIIPLRILYPATGNSGANPYEHLHLATWKREVAREIRIWRRDPNYIPIANFPVGVQQMGGQGKMLLLVNELRSMYEILAAGAGCPQEFVFGGLSYSGSSVSMRMLENDFLRSIEQHQGLVNWVVKKVAHYMNWAPVSVGFKSFKAADDLQRLAYYHQLQASGMLSQQSVVSYADFDPIAEKELIEHESVSSRQTLEKQKLAEAEANGKAEAVMAKYRAKAEFAAQKEHMAAQMAMQKQQMHDQEGMMSRQLQEQTQAQKDMMQSQVGMNMQAQEQSVEQQKQMQQGLAYTPRNSMQVADQNSLTSAGAPKTTPVDLQQLAQKLANMVKAQPEQRGALLKRIEERLGTEMSNLVTAMTANQVDMRPLPEQRPPRRGVQSAII